MKLLSIKLNEINRNSKGKKSNLIKDSVQNTKFKLVRINVIKTKIIKNVNELFTSETIII